MSEYRVCREIDGKKMYIRRLEVKMIALWHEDQGLAMSFPEAQAVRLVDVFRIRSKEGPKSQRRREPEGEYFMEVVQ